MFYRVLSDLCFPETFWIKLDFNLLCVSVWLRSIHSLKKQTTCDFFTTAAFRLGFSLDSIYQWVSACWVALSWYMSFICWFHIAFTSREPGRAMLALRHRAPNWLDIFASPIRAELCTIIVSYLYDQREDLILPPDIWRLSWCSTRVYNFTVRFREIQTPSVADGSSDD